MGNGIYNIIDFMLKNGKSWRDVYEVLEEDSIAPCNINAILNNFLLMRKDYVPSYVEYISTEIIRINKNTLNDLDTIYKSNKSTEEIKPYMINRIRPIIEETIKLNFSSDWKEFFSKPGLENQICNNVLVGLGYSFQKQEELQMKKTK